MAALRGEKNWAEQGLYHLLTPLGSFQKNPNKPAFTLPRYLDTATEAHHFNAGPPGAFRVAKP